MKKAIQIQKQEVLRFPRLDTILMVENFIKEHDGEYKKGGSGSLPKKMMYQTFALFLATCLIRIKSQWMQKARLVG